MNTSKLTNLAYNSYKQNNLDDHTILSVILRIPLEPKATILYIKQDDIFTTITWDWNKVD